MGARCYGTDIASRLSRFAAWSHPNASDSVCRDRLAHHRCQPPAHTLPTPCLNPCQQLAKAPVNDILLPRISPAALSSVPRKADFHTHSPTRPLNCAARAHFALYYYLIPHYDASISSRQSSSLDTPAFLHQAPFFFIPSSPLVTGHEIYCVALYSPSVNSLYTKPLALASCSSRIYIGSIRILLHRYRCCLTASSTTLFHRPSSSLQGHIQPSTSSSSSPSKQTSLVSSLPLDYNTVGQDIRVLLPSKPSTGCCCAVSSILCPLPLLPHARCSR